ncbi:MAG: type II toxin-antitoxin system PemK/MazF family toxin [Candidatus Gracilibacteria bacterium]|jgi:mRNA interferase MazF|nr:type II toxin-antitoxin system PemK/MazF family toxin [Candidatus Gracilibacteria bacterium]
MKQKDIYLANMNPTMGSEQSGKRPVVIISGNTLNTNLNIKIVCPISSKVKNQRVTVCIEKNKKNNLDKDSVVLPFQVRSVSNSRLINKIGEISDNELILILKKLNESLLY